VRTSLAATLFALPAGLLLSVPWGFSTANYSGSSHEWSESARDYSSVIQDLKLTLQQHLRENPVPGAAIALIDETGLVWTEGFGFTDYTKRHPVTPDTQFYLASVCKTYAATLFMKAVERDLVKLDDPVKKYVPDFRVHDRYDGHESDKITFRHLLSHWSGISTEAPVGNNYGEWHCTFNEHVESLTDTWLRSRVGERYRYSNAGMDLVGYALQKCWGRPFERLMSDELLGPLGMRSSGFQDEACRRSTTARGHIQGHRVPDLHVPFLPAGGLWSSARDMAKFVSLHLNGGKVGQEQFIGRDQLTRMYVPQYVVPGRRAGYGLGVEVRPFPGATLVQHGGGGWGFSTDHRWVPEYKVGVVLLTNAQEGDDFVTAVAEQALRGLVRMRLGKLLPEERAEATNLPVKQLTTAELKHLEGTYKATPRLVTFRVEGGELHVFRGGKTGQPLKARGPMSFTAPDGTYEFRLDREGRPLAVGYVGPGGFEDMPVNDTPSDPPGPDRPEWSQYPGTYYAQAWKIIDDDRVVSLRKGYLYWDKLKLFEYRPGLFFTADGETVRFDGDRASFTNKHFLRVRWGPATGAILADFPGRKWQTIDRAGEGNWSPQRLEQARLYAKSIKSAAVLVIYNGRVLCDWGNTAKKYPIGSISESLLAGIYGILAGDGIVDPFVDLGVLGIDDAPVHLTPKQKLITGIDLLQGRCNSSASKGWEANVLNAIVERATRKEVAATFEAKVARTIHMEDFQATDWVAQSVPESSFETCSASMSARDLARFGLLYLRNGQWQKQRVIAEDWIQESTTSYSLTPQAGGYAYRWWTVNRGHGLPAVDLPDGTFWARGAGGHYLLVIPWLDLVIVHRVDPSTPVSPEEFGRLVKLVLQAHN
jgi:CubicO group peptidase (beta-lactamase class C family)